MPSDVAVAARRILAQREQERRACKADLSLLMDRMRMVDEKTGEIFQLHLNDPTHPWYWQRTEVWDAMNRSQVCMFLKARQLGVTWTAAARQLARALTQPGTRYLVFRQREEDAQEVIYRQWQMLQSLPEHLRFGVKVLTPQYGLEKSNVKPAGLIELLHPDGRRSSIKALPPSGDPGHGETTAGVLVDEAARVGKLADVLEAVMATVGAVGEVHLVSTANGVANDEGEGNYFAWLWNTADERGIDPVFLSTELHPDRDASWYDTSSEYLMLNSVQRAAQYPRSPEEAFTGTAGLCYFDEDALSWYAKTAVKQPEYRFEFERAAAGKARKVQSPKGLIRLYEEPAEDVKYAMSVDVASGHGKDNSAVYVVNLETRALCAEIKAKIDPGLLAFQLHFLGRWFNTALIAPETAAGHALAVIVALRDGRSDRPAYPNLLRREREGTIDPNTPAKFGFPMTQTSRGEILPLLQSAIRDRLLPWITKDLAFELSTFVYRDKGTSPRAADGCHDDCVMSAAIALEMYRKYGRHPEREDRIRRRREARGKPVVETQYPWQHA